MLVRIRRLRGPWLRCKLGHRAHDRGYAEEARERAYSPFAAPAGPALDAISNARLAPRDPGRNSPSAVLQTVNATCCVPIAQISTPHKIAEALGFLDRDSRVRSALHTPASC